MTAESYAQSNAMQVSEYMQRNVKTISVEATLKEAGQAMIDHQVGALFVVQGKDYVGIISDKRLARQGAAAGLNPETTSVSAIMRSDLITIASHQSVKEAQTLMKERGVRHLVVTENDQIIGIVSISDLIRYYTDCFDSQ
ncbi:MAG: CBS domain-containing protein [Nitrospirota bacterium]|nr:CBS domain-containing protein [Nitrospirota bacterium]